MAHSHIGHDAKIYDNCEICSGAIIGGYAVIGSGVKIKLGSTIRNRIFVGTNALIGLGSAVVKDVEANTTVYGNPKTQSMKKFAIIGLGYIAPPFKAIKSVGGTVVAACDVHDCGGILIVTTCTACSSAAR